MNMQDILSRIDDRKEAVKKSDAQISTEATGSQDLIRNWRRAVKAGKEPGANFDSLNKVARILDVSYQWLVDGRRARLWNRSVRMQHCPGR